GIEAYPDQRQQQAEGDVADDRGKGPARNDGPTGHRGHQHGDPAIERENDCHVCHTPSRASRAMSWATVAPASWTSSHTATSFSPPSGASARANKPSPPRPRPRLSALVSACRRVRVSGKRSSPTVPARKKKMPAMTARTVKVSATMLMLASPPHGLR